MKKSNERAQIPLTEKKVFTYDDLMEIMRMLRGEGGCPWDRAQTHDSIKINLIEEAYELVDAIDKKDDKLILEETGDVLLQSVFHAAIAEDRGAFTSSGVITELCKKLITRHSHIFSGDSAATEESALGVWEKNKLKEKQQHTFSQTLEDLPKSLPSCLYAEKLQKRAAKSGFDFENLSQASNKIYEELDELSESIASGEGIFEEGGDLLFSVINLLRMLKVDSESALKASSYKFKKRFSDMENLILSRGEKIQDLTAEKLDGYYNEAKKNKD